MNYALPSLFESYRVWCLERYVINTFKLQLVEQQLDWWRSDAALCKITPIIGSELTANEAIENYNIYYFISYYALNSSNLVIYKFL